MYATTAPFPAPAVSPDRFGAVELGSKLPTFLVSEPNNVGIRPIPLVTPNFEGVPVPHSYSATAEPPIPANYDLRCRAG